MRVRGAGSRAGASLLALVASALLSGCGSAAPADAAEQRGYGGVLLPEPLQRPDFTLQDTGGRPFDFRKETEGRLTLVFVGYTHCPDVCPVHMANLAAVLRREPEVAARTRVVFITADPARDTPERMREWLGRFDPSFVGLRGTVEEVNRVEEALGLPRSAAGTAPTGDYPVAHAGQIVAFSPDGPARIIYPFGTRQAELAKDLPRLLDDGWDGG